MTFGLRYSNQGDSAEAGAAIELVEAAEDAGSAEVRVAGAGGVAQFAEVIEQFADTWAGPI